MLRGGKHAGRAAVLTVAQRRGGGVRIRLITPSRILVSLSEPDFDQPVQRVGEIDLPTPFAPNRQSYQREVARELDRVRPRPERAEIVVAESGLRDEPADPILRDPQLDDRLEGRGPGRPRGPRGPRAGGPDRQPCRLARSPVRSRRSHPRDLGLPRRLGAHRVGREARLALPRERPAAGRGDRARASRRPRPRRPGRCRLALHLRAPQPRRAPRAVVPVDEGPRPMSGDRRVGDRAQRHRGRSRARPHSRARTRPSSRSPTRGRPAKPSTTCSRTKTCRAATSCGT